VQSCRALAAALLLGSITCLPTPASCQQTRAIETAIDGPSALAVDREGHLFVASLYENNVRRIDLKTGTIETVAGNGKECCYQENSKAVDVNLDIVSAIAVNSTGDIFISEGTQVRKVDSETGLISTVAGNGESGDTADGLLATSTNFSLIWGLAVDADDNLFVADKGQGKIFKIETASGPVGKVHLVAGNGRNGFKGDGGPALDAVFSSLGSIAFDNNRNLLVADDENCRIRRIDRKTGIIHTAAVTEPLAACLKEAGPWPLPFPTDLTVDPEGRIMFTETAENVVMRVDKNLATPSIIAGTGDRDFSGDSGPAVDAALSGPSGLAIDSKGNLYIGDIRNNRVRRVDAVTKTIATVAGNGKPNVIHSEE
jgi:sugar lactone lactonase YvrE